MAKRGRASKDEINFINENRGKMDAAEMAEKLDRTVEFVTDKLKTPTQEAGPEKIVNDRKKVLHTPIQKQMNPEDGPKGVTIMTPAVSAASDEIPKSTTPSSRYAKSIREVRK